MTADRDLDRRLGSWFADRSIHRAPDGLLERSLERVDGTRQRPGWIVRDRGPASGLPRQVRLLTAITLLSVAAIIGVLADLAGPGWPAGVGPGAGASPTPAPTSAATTAPSPFPTPRATPDIPSLSGPMGIGRQIHTATELADGRVLVVGGYDNKDAALASAALYDPTTDSFSPTGSLAEARGLHAATLLADGRVLVTGGGVASWASSTGDYLASAELYNPATGTFSPTGPMTTAREDHTSTLLTDGRVLITGGNDFGSRTAASAEIYDPATGTFSPTGSMTTARAFHTATLLADGRVLVEGGDPASWLVDTPLLASAEIYDPATGTFSPTGSMTTARAFHTATLLADGRVLVTGGADDSRDLASSELFDPKSGTFSPTGPMGIGRIYHTATLLADGRVLVAGGGGDYTNRLFIDSAEVYDPATGTFAPTGSMTEARTYHAATQLPDGRVLVTGGFGADAPLASAEIFDPRTSTFTAAGSGH